jgi:hypothetical protein
VRKLPPAGRRGVHDRTVAGGQPGGTGEEVGVQVGVGCCDNAKPVPGRGGIEGAQVPGRVDRQRAAVAQVDQVAAVAQTIVDDRKDRTIDHDVLLAPVGHHD